MKKVLVLILALALVMLATSAFATVANTKHNLTPAGLFATKAAPGSTTTLCGFCHVPHGAAVATDTPPLWGRTLDTGITYQVYGAPAAGAAGVTASGTVVSITPGTHSLTCLSCHDGAWGLGVVTKNGFDTPDQSFVGNVIAGTSLLDPTAAAFTFDNPVLTFDLRNDHPVGLQYRGPAATKAGLKAKDAGLPSVTTGANVYPLYGAAGDQLDCGSCHDPHQENAGGKIKFLRGATATLCQDCHATK